MLMAKMQVKIVVLLFAFILTAKLEAAELNQNQIKKVIDSELKATTNLLHLFSHKKKVLCQLLATLDLKRFNNNTQDNGTLQSICTLNNTKKIFFSHQSDVLNSPNLNSHSALNSRLHFDDVVLTRYKFHFSQQVTVVQLVTLSIMPYGLSRSRRKNTQEFRSFVVVCFANGLMQFTHPLSGEVQHEFDTGQTNIDKIYFSSQGVVSMMTSSTDGSIRLFHLTLWQEMRLVSGKRRRFASLIQRKYQCIRKASRLPKFDNSQNAFWNKRNGKQGLVIQDYSIFFPPRAGEFIDIDYIRQLEKPSQFAENVSHILVINQFKEVYYIVATASNKLRVYLGNGSCAHEFQLQAPIRSITLISRYVAFTSRNSVSFLCLSRMEIINNLCTGTVDHITHLETDAIRSGLLYAGTTAGTVIIFKIWLNFRVQSKESCHLFYQLSSTQSEIQNCSTTIAIFRGFLLFTSGKSVVMYNTSQIAFKKAQYLFENDLLEKDNNTGNRLLSIQTSKDETPQNFIILNYLLQNGSRETLVLESLVSYQDIIYDVSWIRGPLMLFGVFSVFGWQIYRKKQTQHRMSREDMQEFASGFNKWDRSQGRSGLPFEEFPHKI